MRTRSLKPGFFQNEDLGELPPLTRLLFQGLWCLADREGRLEDRPKRIKVAVLPYDECDTERMLADLAERDFIERYQVDGQRCIQVTHFQKHQVPHQREAASELPPPPGSCQSTAKAQPRLDQGSALAVPEPGLGDGEAQPRSPGTGTGIPEPEYRELELELEPGAPSRAGAPAGAREFRVFPRKPTDQSATERPGDDDENFEVDERTLLVAQLRPISTALGDDRPASSVTRVQKLMHRLNLDSGTMSNAIKDALHRTHKRLDALDQPRVSAPMPWFLGTLEECARERSEAGGLSATG